MKILVTGANGFVGASLCRRLLAQNITVHAAIRLPTAALPDSPLVEPFVVGSIDERTVWTHALQGVDAVIHLAARVHMMQDNAADPMKEFIKINTDATVNLARQAAASGVKRFVYLSSIKVNGEAAEETSPFREVDKPSPQDPYAISKLRAEEALAAISRETGMEVVIVRPPLVYGPGVKANFYKLLQLADKSMPLPLSKIRNKRSLIFVENLSDALFLCATHSAAGGQTYLVSDGQDVSTAELFKGIAQALNCSAHMLPVPIWLMRFAGGITGKSAAIDRLTQSLVIDSTKIRNELNWTPPFTLRQGLQITADWYRSTAAV